MELLLSRFADIEPKRMLALLIDKIRPANAHDFEAARRNLQALCHILNTRPELRRAMRETLLRLSESHRHSELYTATGILPNTGFFSECFRRIGHKVLPEALGDDLLRTAVRQTFRRASDAYWVLGVGEDAWLQLVEALHLEEQSAVPELSRPVLEVLGSLRVISYWIAAFGMEPELLRLDRALETYASPFVTQNEVLVAYIAVYPLAWRQADIERDDKHLRVLLDQCMQVIERIRKRAARQGTSIRLTYHLQRLQQLIERSEQLLDILATLQRDPDGGSAYPAIVRLFMRLVHGECQRDNLRQHWRNNIELIALRVTSNVSAHGEHYITETRGEFFGMARSATVGGCIIAFMACLKLVLTDADMAPLTGALAFCLNYGLGFCLIHIVHGMVATKQPAMTANTIAASISQSGGKLRDIEVLSAMVAGAVRSQIVATLGNIGVAVPVAGLIAWTVRQLSGEAFVDADKALRLLGDQSLITSGAVFYAAIAGVCLFVAGLISGYYDNYAVYNRVPERIEQLEWTRRLFGEARMRRVSAYVGDNLGALAGNLFFGFLLGGVTIFGVLFGLQLDIRHVAFSSAFIGIAFVGLDFSPDSWALLWAVLGMICIGWINLTVSFALALVS